MVKFTRKKIETLTLGERMVKKRTERHLSVLEISRATNIQVKYLTFLESGEYSKLPADVYVKGFIKSYAAFMGLNEDILVKQYLREKDIHTNIKQVGHQGYDAKRPIRFSSFVLTPKAILVSLAIFAVIGSFWYLYNQVNSFVSSPRLVILKPADGSVVDGKMVHIAGVTDRDAALFINDQQVLVNENGEFSEDIGLKDGLNVIIAKAKNRFDKKSEKVVSVRTQQQENVLTTQSESSEGVGTFVAEIRVEPNPTWVSIESDGSLVYSGTLVPNSTEKIEAREAISVTTGSGNGTFVRVNGNDLGPVSEGSGTASDVRYNREGRINNE